MARREFTRSVYAEIVHRAMNADGAIVCEGCGLVLGKKPYQIDHTNGIPYVIENVVGAPLRNAFTLCGTMFGLGVDDAQLQRHRQFEASFPVLAPKCQHRRGARTIGIYGEGCRDSRRKFDKTIPEFTVQHGRLAMDAPWMTLAELCQAIPPAYAEFIGRAALAQASRKAAA